MTDENTKIIKSKLRKLSFTSGDAKVIFEKLAEVSPDFNNFLDSFYNDFNRDELDPELINKNGLIALQTGIELKKIGKKLNNLNPEEYNNYIMNAIVLTYGYSALFNQAIDEGFIEDKLTRQLKDYSNRKGISELELFSTLDTLEPSILTKRYYKAIELINDKEVMGELNNLLDVQGLFDDGKMREASTELNEIYAKTSLESNKLFLGYSELFKINYFPLLSEIRLLSQVKTQGVKDNKKKVNTPVADDFEKLKRLYIEIKKWKDISGIEINAGQLRLYFEMFADFARINKIELYSPIKKFIKVIRSKNKEYSQKYNLGDLHEAKMELDSWSNILEN